MATDTFPQSNHPDAANVLSRADSNTLSATDVVRAILAPLASLKLTVFLLVLATAVTFIGTLEQTRADIDTVKHRYFLENVIFVEVPLQTFFVPAWFPSLQNVPGTIHVPSGMTILILMMINLTAAHMLRFRLQASGIKLAAGIIVALFAAVVTWVIIFNSSATATVNSDPPIPWHQMWVLLQIVILGIACWAGGMLFSIGKERKIEKILCLLMMLTFGGLLCVTLYLGEAAFIGNSAMRIVWQLTQASLAASVSLVACFLLFKRKAGMVLLHLGIVGLMANELYVNATNEEQQMMIPEGATVNEAFDVRTTELAIVDTSDPEFDTIINVPGRKLQSGQVIDDPQLPFIIETVKYFPNSDIEAIKSSVDNPASTGIGKIWNAVSLPVKTGTGMEEGVDQASAYLKLSNKESGESLGTFLVSQLLNLKGADVVTVGDKTYRILLRFKTEYKPVALTLKDFEATFYPGTTKPRSFTAQVQLKDSVSGNEFDHKIWMNNPLRFGGETFYQQRWGQDPATGQEHTILQVVKNRGWMIPYVCCMFTVIGLVVQFGSSLLGFLEKDRSSNSKSKLAANSDDTEPQEVFDALVTDATGPAATTKTNWLGWLPALALVGMFTFYVAGEAYKASTATVENDGMRLDLLGQLPITYNGRVQPLDSFARHTALKLVKRETVMNRNESSQPAIRWLADLMFQEDGFADYRLFRIEDPEVLASLKLPYPMPTPERAKHSNLRYTLEEVYNTRSQLLNLIPVDKDFDELTLTQQRIRTIGAHLQLALTAEKTLGNPGAAPDHLLERLDMAKFDAKTQGAPLIVPSDDPQQPWTSLTQLEHQAWIADLAKKHSAKTTDELTAKLLESDVLPGLRKEMIRSSAIARLLESPEALEVFTKQFGESDPKKLERIMSEKAWDSIPATLREPVEAAAAPMVDLELTQLQPRLSQLLSSGLVAANGSAGPIHTISKYGELLLKLRPAYEADDAATFNRTLTEYLALVKSNPPTEASLLGLATERWYNGFAPFYLSMVLYLVAMLIGMIAWIVWEGPLSRAACGLLMLGFLIQVVGLIARVMISGRPPVTNLYSSFLFVSAVVVLGLVLLEIWQRLRVGYVLAGATGFLGLMAAWNLSLNDGDTFAVLEAVLDTQFWLATHVVCISIGYGATMIAAALGMAYVVMGMLSPAMDKSSRRIFANVIYGVICFGLVTSFFGTVLGGLWADDSWGRFWGWDPKENGALMIVLWNAVSLHARWGGMIRERGLAALAILGGVVTMWSWKGVNAMGVGLHAYGGTEDKTMLYFIALGLISSLIAATAMIPTKYWMSYSRD